MKRLIARSRSIRTRMFVRTSAVMVLVIFCMVFILRMLMVSRLKSDQTELRLMETQNQLGQLDNYLMTLMVKTDALFANQEFSDMITASPTDITEKTSLASGLRKAMDLAIIGVGCKITMDGDVCTDAKITLGAVAIKPIHAVTAEQMMIGQKVTDELLDKVGVAAMNDCSPISDIRASAEYRKDMVRVFTKRVIKQALEA